MVVMPWAMLRINPSFLLTTLPLVAASGCLFTLVSPGFQTATAAFAVTKILDYSVRCEGREIYSSINNSIRSAACYPPSDSSQLLTNDRNEAKEPRFEPLGTHALRIGTYISAPAKNPFVGVTTTHSQFSSNLLALVVFPLLRRGTALELVYQAMPEHERLLGESTALHGRKSS